jgi:hypothetical protein
MTQIREVSPAFFSVYTLNFLNHELAFFVAAFAVVVFLFSHDFYCFCKNCMRIKWQSNLIIRFAKLRTANIKTGLSLLVSVSCRLKMSVSLSLHGRSIEQWHSHYSLRQPITRPKNRQWWWWNMIC